MSKAQLLVEILGLPVAQRRRLIRRAIDSLPEGRAFDPAMTPALRAELERRYADMLAHPEDEMSWEEASARLSKLARRR